MLLQSGATNPIARLFSALLGALMCLAIAGCASSDSSVASVADANRMVGQEFRLASGDHLRVTVFGEPTLTAEYEVGVGGTVTLPLISEVPAAGQTPTQLASAISTRLEQGGFVLAPKVAVDVLSHRPVYLLGEVNKPGEYPYEGGLTFHQAIAKAGGFTPRASRGTIVLQRSGWAASRTIKLNGEPLVILPGDTIIVKEAFF
ncbi:polysaccharide export outer membrane protein [Sphingomonas laterariae]|uniref:Polysaccharide export outer membrane protein n=1 Tax=Edaphosphingomonas laterariae TaxID=861865 RepID=A0A239IP06_9SPHN|nr:polysaccharide biosynthesis/export family protein [Sphingomonas laterariae]SNS94144.1 polysaccharide export outer membrane protein [Sphingomonas laterariae]